MLINTAKHVAHKKKCIVPNKAKPSPLYAENANPLVIDQPTDQPNNRHIGIVSLLHMLKNQQPFESLLICSMIEDFKLAAENLKRDLSHSLIDSFSRF